MCEIARAYQDFGSIERMLADTDLTERQIRLSLAYYERFPEEIDAAIADDRRSLGGLREHFPTIGVLSS